MSAVTLVALGRGERPLEAAFKYFVLGAVSLAGLLYGLGLIYLSTNSFAFPTASQLANNPITLAGAVLVGLGIAFELAVFPLHWGALDAYTAAAPSLAGYVMSASKIAAAFALGRLVLASGVPVAQFLVWVGSLTIIWGTFGALARAVTCGGCWRYSAVTHAGFIALAAGSGPNGPATAAFYAAVYGAMAMLVFAALAACADRRHLQRWVAALGRAGPGPVVAERHPTDARASGPSWRSGGRLAGRRRRAHVDRVAGGVFSVLYYLRPCRGSSPRCVRPMHPTAVRPIPGIVLAALLVIAFGLFRASPGPSPRAAKSTPNRLARRSACGKRRWPFTPATSNAGHHA